jgi:stage IV sporulation protein FB
MEIRNPALGFAFSLGHFGGVRVRVSYLFPLLIAVCLMKLGVELGLAVSVLLVLSVLFHEFAHIWMARATGGSGDEIFLWPLGGLAMVQTQPTLKAKFLTALAGPLSNGLICLACLPATWKFGTLRDALNPLQLPFVDFKENWGLAIQTLAFSLNWIQMLVNLLPILPLDGGQMLISVLEERRPRLESRTRAVVFSMVGGIVITFAGMALDSTALITLSTLILVLNLDDFYRTRIARMMEGEGEFDSGYMGYDFSQGYTSLEKNLDDPDDTEVQAAVTAKEERRRQREAEERAAAEKRLDELLEKVHQHGMKSLSDEERRFLQTASSRYRRS